MLEQYNDSNQKKRVSTSCGTIVSVELVNAKNDDDLVKLVCIAVINNIRYELIFKYTKQATEMARTAIINFNQHMANQLLLHFLHQNS